MLVKSSTLGLLAASVPNIVYSKNILSTISDDGLAGALPHDRYPAVQLEVAAEVRESLGKQMSKESESKAGKFFKLRKKVLDSTGAK